eukprot:scaffold27710_cov62-Phaeocystis_antarctica.AAC.5
MECRALKCRRRERQSVVDGGGKCGGVAEAVDWVEAVGGEDKVGAGRQPVVQECAIGAVLLALISRRSALISGRPPSELHALDDAAVEYVRCDVGSHHRQQHRLVGEQHAPSTERRGRQATRARAGAELEHLRRRRQHRPPLLEQRNESACGRPQLGTEPRVREDRRHRAGCRVVQLEDATSRAQVHRRPSANWRAVGVVFGRACGKRSLACCADFASQWT